MVDGIIGKPLDRTDGRLKVTGGAKYAAEFQVQNVAHGALVQSTIANGTIKSVDISQAEKVQGVLKILTPFNCPQLSKLSSSNQQRPLLDSNITYSGQTFGIVVAETLEQAQYAADLITAEYDVKEPKILIEDRKHEAAPAQDNFGGPGHKVRGDIAAGLSAATTKIEETYRTPNEHHNPMEPHATLAYWENPESLVAYDATQGVISTQYTLAGTFGLKPNQVHVMSPFLGGGFGCKGNTWPHVKLAALAARETGRPVKVVLTRKQMFSSNGHREETIQKNTFGADAEGKLTVMHHDMHGQTSINENFLESTGAIYQILYSCPNIEVDQKLVKCNVGSPTYTRAPGEASGSFGLEAAMDELAYAAKMDPIEFRLKNYAEKDESENKPWSSKSLRQCYAQGAEEFGWSKRNPEPGSMKKGNLLVGYGMATASYPANYWNSACRVIMDAKGKVTVQICSQDIGTGAYTIYGQIAADTLGVPMQNVNVQLADSNLPPGPLSAGSNSAATAGSAVYMAAKSLRSDILALVTNDSSSAYFGAKEEDFSPVHGGFRHKSGKEISYRQILDQCKKPVIERELSVGSGTGPPAGPPPEIKWSSDEYSKHAFGAQFCEIHIDPELRMMRVVRWVGAFAVGRVLNAKTLTSQLQGGVVWGIGMGLLEETVPDEKYARFINTNLAEYHVPVNKDVPDIKIIIVPEDDPHVNPLGVKGAGEIGITGAAAAICNAVYQATGKRVRDLPITLDKIL